MELLYSIFMLLFKIHYFLILPTGTYKQMPEPGPCTLKGRTGGENECKKVIPSRGSSVCPGFKVRNSKNCQYSSMPHKTHIL